MTRTITTLTPAQEKQFARDGARARLDELRQEQATILKAFPGLGMRTRPRTATPRKHYTMSAAKRKAVSARMKAYWTEWRRTHGSS